MIAGSPDDVAEKLNELQKMGIHYLICWTDIGGFPHESAMRTLDLLGSKILPLFKDQA
ncbi:MAG: hypothetical protein ACE5JO_11775 [Candidatus Binatia bacterium]